MQPHAALRRQFRRLSHQPGRDGKWRARRERHLQHGVRRRVVQLVDQPGAVDENGVGVLHHAVGRQPTVALAEVH